MKIQWLWREFPLGFPLDPEDDDFRGERTPPFVSLSLRYDGNIVLRNGLMIQGTRATLTSRQVEIMYQQLTEWLFDELNQRREL